MLDTEFLQSSKPTPMSSLFTVKSSIQCFPLAPSLPLGFTHPSYTKQPATTHYRTVSLCWVVDVHTRLRKSKKCQWPMNNNFKCDTAGNQGRPMKYPYFIGRPSSSTITIYYHIHFSVTDCKHTKKTRLEVKGIDNLEHTYMHI